QQLSSIFTDIDINAIKIGMLHNDKIITTVAHSLQKFKTGYIVLDPVMVAKNGSPLIHPENIHLLKEKLFSLSFLITPNLFEAEAILQIKIQSSEDMQTAARKIGEQFKI